MIGVRSGIRLCGVALLIGVVAACASDPSKPRTTRTSAMEDDPSKGIICTNEAPVGSFLTKKICTTPEQREQQRRDSEHQIVVETPK